MPKQQRVWFENQHELLQPGFLGMSEAAHPFQQSNQDEFLSLANRQSTFLMPPQDQQLLAEEEQLDGLVVC